MYRMDTCICVYIYMYIYIYVYIYICIYIHCIYILYIYINNLEIQTHMYHIQLVYVYHDQKWLFQRYLNVCRMPNCAWWNKYVRNGAHLKLIQADLSPDDSGPFLFHFWFIFASIVGKPTSFVDVYRYHVLLKAGDIPYKLQVKDAWGLRSLLSICIGQRKVHIKSLKKKAQQSFTPVFPCRISQTYGFVWKQGLQPFDG